MRRATPSALLTLLALSACEEPDRWVVISNPGGNGLTVAGRWSNGSGGSGGGTTIIWHGNSSGSGSHSQLPASPVVNAPVAPEAIYLGFGGTSPGIGVLDLNGFGQGTGNLATTRFHLNPNLGVPGVVPPLAPGTSNLDAGSAGALTLTQDSNGSTHLLAPLLGDVSDLQLGQPLDLLYNNGAINRFAEAPNQVNPMTGLPMPGNTISIAPHPNPPRLVLPPPNPAMHIECEEPTVASTVGPPYPFLGTSPPQLPSPANLLVAGNPFATQPGMVGIFGAQFPGVFFGPQPSLPPPQPPPPFVPFVSRQQIGHFLYAIDRAAARVVVLNSNRMTPLAAIPMPDPVDLAMSPDLARLAVSNGSTGDVRFVDTNPQSPTFHQVVAQTRLAPGITRLAWQPEGEDLLVLNPGMHSLALVDGRSLQLRKLVGNALFAPRALAVGSRETTFGFQSGLWYAYVLNGDGSVAVFESGPAAIGHDEVIGFLEEHFPNATAIMPDAGLLPGFWVAHQDASGLGQLSLVQLTSSPSGPLPLPGPPATAMDGTDQFRQKVWSVVQRQGGSNPTTPIPTLLSGNAIVDLAFDEIVNVGALPDQQSPVVPGLRYALHSGKNLVKLLGSTVVPARSPRLLFVAMGDTGTVDVLELATGRRLATVPAPGIRALCNYWRQ